MRKRLLVVVTTVAAMAVLPAGIAHANNGDASSAAAVPPAPQHATTRVGSDVTFFGSGWGHGVGMSQWGSYGLAKMGWSYTDILTRYYSNTTVSSAPSGSPTSVRVGLAWGQHTLHITAQNGAATLRFGSPTNTDKYTMPPGKTWTVSADANGHFHIVNALGHVFTIGGPNWKMFASYTPNHAQLHIAEADPLPLGHSYGNGYIEFNSYKVGSSFDVRAVGVLPPDQYLYGLGEVPSSWPMNALKTQAVAARTYAFYVIEVEHHGTRYSDCNCDLYPDARSQSYRGTDHASDPTYPDWVQAVNQTSGQVVLYHGGLILANYYSSSGGYTENNEDVWFNQRDPYLRSVCDPGDYSAPPQLRVWKVTMSRSQVGADLGLGSVSSFTGVTRSTNSGRIISITANTAAGAGGLRGTSRTMEGPTFSAALGLMDDKVWIDQNRNITGAIRLQYDALNCAPGLAMTAQFPAGTGQVQRFRTGAIYQNFKADKTVWLYGAPYTKYRAFGGAGSPLGLPVSTVIKVTGAPGCGSQTCVRADFAGGRIYRKGSAPAHEVHGSVETYYVNHGAAMGPLGFPTSDVQGLPGGGAKATFEHGTVTCPASGGCTTAPSP
jgi:SpoIID/LytB domain protein